MGIEGACGYFLVIALLNNQQQHSVCTSYNHEEMSLTLISSNIKEIETLLGGQGHVFVELIYRCIGRCGQPWQLKLLTDQDTWDAYVGAGIFCFNSSPSLV